jgi:hypothetical protein
MGMRSFQQQKLCETILAEMSPTIRAYHNNRWVQPRKQESFPRDPEKLYSEWRQRTCHKAD